MIIGNPDKFAIFYDVFEQSADGYWQFGPFNFIINNNIYPAKTGNYTLRGLSEELKDSCTLMLNHRKNNLILSVDDELAFKILSHSYSKLVYSELVYYGMWDGFQDPPPGKEPPELPYEPIGVVLGPLEVQDYFELYYYSEDESTEYLIYSMDCGKTVKKSSFTKGTVAEVLRNVHLKSTETEVFETKKMIYKANPNYNERHSGKKYDPKIETDLLIELFKKSVPLPDQYGNKKIRYATDSHGNLHRFDGTRIRNYWELFDYYNLCDDCDYDDLECYNYYWSGSSSNNYKKSLTANKVPAYIQNTLGVKLK